MKEQRPVVFIRRALRKLRKLVNPARNAQPNGQTGEQAAREYRRWMEQNEPTLAELAGQAQTAAGWAYQPLLSILTPVFNPDPQALRAMIASVLAQTYPHWELCLVDAASEREGVAEVLKTFAAQDERIRLERLERNLGISGNSNAALQLAQGQFVALLDHDDTLAPFALFEVVQHLNAEPECDLIYSDHDLLSSQDGLRYAPLFKPGWSPEIMLSSNYLTHLTVIRTRLVREAGGFDPEMDGAQDWDLFLKVVERTQRVAHIPKVLYHWRDAPGSTADDIWAKPYAPPAQLRAIGAHLNRRGLAGAEAFFDKTGFIRVRWQIARPGKVSIIIPSNGANALLETCVHSILTQTAYPDFEIIIVNNGPSKPDEFSYYRHIEQDDRVRVVHHSAEIFNYSATNNYGAGFAAGEYLLFLNNDTEVIEPEWLIEMVMWASLDEVGVVGAKLLLENGTIQHAGVIIGLTGFAGHIFGGRPENLWSIFGLAEWYRSYLAVTAACMMIRRDLFEQVGRFDETFILCGNDVEICLRVRSSGRKVVYNPFARLYHKEGATRQGSVPAQDFHTSYPHYLPALQAGDPYFNPNLSCWSLSPTLAKPGENNPHDFVRGYLHNLKGPHGNAVC